jgi:hypothetical protein
VGALTPPFSANAQGRIHLAGKGWCSSPTLLIIYIDEYFGKTQDNLTDDKQPIKIKIVSKDLDNNDYIYVDTYTVNIQ